MGSVCYHFALIYGKSCVHSNVILISVKTKNFKMYTLVKKGLQLWLHVKTQLHGIVVIIFKQMREYEDRNRIMMVTNDEIT